MITWLQQLPDFFVDPSKRLFWGFLLSSIIIIILHWLWTGKKITVRRFLRTFFNRSYWLTRSSLVDVSFLSLNSFLRVVVLVPLLGSHLAAAIWVARTLQTNIGNAPELMWPWWLIASLYTLTFFLFEDLSRFLLHRAMHKNPYLWKLHRVHHSATTLTPLTLHRIHPIEMLLYYMRGLCIFSLVSGSFIYVAGKQLTAWQILGVDALGFAFNFFAANLRHSHIWLSFGVFERWLISPAQHQIHHSSAEVHRDKNFGTCLALWDRLAQSWVPALSKKRYFSFGL